MDEKWYPAPANVGDVFAVPLENGVFTICRVIKANRDLDGNTLNEMIEPEAVLVVCSAWLGKTPPELADPALREYLTEPFFIGGWIHQRVPKKFVPIGCIEPNSNDLALNIGSGSSWTHFILHPQAKWNKENPDDVAPPRPFPPGKFELRRINGKEVFPLKSAVIFGLGDKYGIDLWFEAEAALKGATQCSDTKSLEMAPKVEVGLSVPRIDPDKLVGRTFVVKGTKQEYEDSMSLIYCFGHFLLKKNRIKILSRTGDKFQVGWTARYRGFNFLGTSESVAKQLFWLFLSFAFMTRIKIEGEFHFEDIEEWMD